MNLDIYSLTQTIAILFIGYSLLVSLQIIVTGFSQDYYRTRRFEWTMGMVLLFALAGLQFMHFLYLQHQLTLIQDLPYHVLLFIVAPAFYQFSRPLLFAETHHHFGWGWGWGWGLHFLPITIIPFFPQTFIMPLAFSIGALYLLWLARSIYALRAQRNRFKLELWILCAVFIIAVSVSLLGLGILSLPEKWFIALYSIAIGCALLLVNIVLFKNPQLSVEIAEAARETYAVSTLNQVNCNEKLNLLKTLMDRDQRYKDPELDLAMLAKELTLSQHQLSELINIHLGKHFARYIREYRIQAAQKLLESKPSRSVLSISMEVGFTSQSNFYTAFREITGMSPGQYRKLKLSK